MSPAECDHLLKKILPDVKRRDILRADRRIDLRAFVHVFLHGQGPIDLGLFYLEGTALKNSKDVASSPLSFFGNERRSGCHGQGFCLNRLILS